MPGLKISLPVWGRGNAALPSRVAGGETWVVRGAHSQPWGDSGTDLDEVQGDQVSGRRKVGVSEKPGGPGRLSRAHAGALEGPVPEHQRLG